MGKHVAPEGASADPIVADALAHRPTGAGQQGAGHHAAAENPVGWPGEPAREGGRVGWPGDLPPAAATPATAPATAPEEAPAPVEAPVARRGWRRLFGAGHVA